MHEYNWVAVVAVVVAEVVAVVVAMVAVVAVVVAVVAVVTGTMAVPEDAGRDGTVVNVGETMAVSVPVSTLSSTPFETPLSNTTTLTKL